MTADLPPEWAADELAAVSQEPGRGDEAVIRTEDDAMRYLYGGIYTERDRGTYGDGTPSYPGDPGREHEQPTAREIPADELAEAELPDWTTDELITEWLAHPAARRRIRAELDGRGRERDAARAEVERLRTSWEAIRDLNIDLQAEVERLHTWAGLMSLLDEHYPADVVTGESGDPGPRIVALAREVERLRARDEKAKDVVEAWRDPDHDQSDDLRDALNALARAHEDGGRAS